MNGLGAIINQATELSPLPMGILVSVIVGMVLTAPISSAALCIMLDLSGLAAGAAAVGCSAQMIGFAVASFRENRWGGLLSQGIGTSMLQFSNIMKKPQIWIAPTWPARPRPDLHLRVPDDQYRHRRGHGNQRPCRAIWRFCSYVWNRTTVANPPGNCSATFYRSCRLTLLFDFVLRKIGWVKDGDMKINI